MRNKFIIFNIAIIALSFSSCTNIQEVKSNIYLDCSSLKDTSEVIAWSLGYISYSPDGQSFSQHKNGIKINRQSYNLSSNNTTMFAINNNLIDTDNNRKTFFFGFEIIDNQAKVIALDNESFSDIEENKDEIIKSLNNTSSSCKVLTESEFSILVSDTNHTINWLSEFNDLKSIDFLYDNSYSQIYLTLLEDSEYYVSIFGYDYDTMKDINIGYNDKYIRVFNNFYKLLNFKYAMNDEANDYYLEINEDNAILYLYDLRLKMLIPLFDLSI